MDVIYFSKTLGFSRSERRYTPEERILQHNLHFEHLNLGINVAPYFGPCKCTVKQAFRYDQWPAFKVGLTN
jgi:hypothetical protein